MRPDMATAQYGRTVISTPSLDGVSRWLVIVCVVVFLLQTAAPSLTLLLGLDALGPRPWQILTYAVCHGDPWHLVFNMLALWMLGTAVEGVLGPRRYLTLMGLCVVVSGLVWLALYHGTMALLLGFSGAAFGLLYAFAFFFPDRELILFIFPVRSRTLVAILVAVSLYLLLTSPGGVAHAVHLCGLAVAAVYLDVLAGSRLRDLRARVMAARAELRFRWRSRHLTVIPGRGGRPTEPPDEDEGPPPGTPIH